ncbi:MAG: CvpA family protein [Lachnospiraceae bacterium]|nr:CvpA family protein [Lachnospiraceae bacterium]
MKKRGFSGFLWRFLICAIVIFGLYYVELPPLHPRSESFWSFLFQAVLVILVVNGAGVIKDLFSAAHAEGIRGFQSFHLREISKPFLIGAGALVLIVVIQFAGSVIGHPIFHSGAYSKLISVEDGDFAADVAELSMNQIPVVDKASAQRLGNRKLGEMSDLVSQFEIMDMYTQINYKGTPYRVTPLQYGDVIKCFSNRSEGLPAYVMVNMVTQETSLKRLDEGMKYSTSEYFFRNINRYLRFSHPTLIFDFDDISFEIDESGTPYWVAPVINYRIGIWSGKDISGAVLVNAVTGENTYYKLEDIPSWVDQVFISKLIVNQLDYYGMYQNGFFNSMFGQKGVKQTTDGYNYITIGDDVYLYTGMTSVTSDDSNTGFMLVNLRTKEAEYYPVPGATEYSAMLSAEGQVQQMNYDATFPLLLNVSDRPTYFLSLKDAAGLVKMYAFVDVEQYQIVGTGTSIKTARSNYETALGIESGEVSPNQQGNSGGNQGGAQTTEPEEPLTPEASITGTISAISSAVVNGNTRYYILLEEGAEIYTASITLDPGLPFLKSGDKVTLEYATAGNTRSICSITVNR